LQRVLVRAGELVNARPVAAFRIYAADSLNGGGVTRGSDSAPSIAFAVSVKIDVERAIGPTGPNSAERVGPCAGDGGLSCARISGASVDEHQNEAGKKELKTALDFHSAILKDKERSIQVLLCGDRLLSMPRERHVFDPLFAAVLNQRERQSVFGAAAETIHARVFAAFRGTAASFLDCNSIPGYRDIAPNVAFRSDDIEGVIGFDRPDSAERVCPCADERC